MKRNNVYEIEYRYNDEEEFHYALMVVYSTGTKLGDAIQKALDDGNESGSFVELDKLMYDKYKLDDNDICFYFDRTDMVWDLKTSIERSYDIEIKDMWVERS